MVRSPATAMRSKDKFYAIKMKAQKNNQREDLLDPEAIATNNALVPVIVSKALSASICEQRG